MTANAGPRVASHVARVDYVSRGDVLRQIRCRFGCGSSHTDCTIAASLGTNLVRHLHGCLLEISRTLFEMIAILR